MDGWLTWTWVVPYYSVRAQSVDDIQASVRFASEKDLYLVTKNTGHDQYVSSSFTGMVWYGLTRQSWSVERERRILDLDA